MTEAKIRIGDKAYNCRQLLSCWHDLGLLVDRVEVTATSEYDYHGAIFIKWDACIWTSAPGYEEIRSNGGSVYFISPFIALHDAIKQGKGYFDRYRPGKVEALES